MSHRRDATVHARFKECLNAVEVFKKKNKTKCKIETVFVSGRDEVVRENWRNITVSKMLEDAGYTVAFEPTLEKVLESKTYLQGVSLYLVISWPDPEDE